MTLKKRTIAPPRLLTKSVMRQEKGTVGNTRYELTQLIRLALPLVVAQLAQMGMGVADTIMAGQVGALELAGVALGGAMLWPTLMLFSGVVMSTTPMIAQLNGAGKDSEVGEITRQGLWVALGLGVLLTIGLKNAQGRSILPWVSRLRLLGSQWGTWPPRVGAWYRCWVTSRCVIFAKVFPGQSQPC